MPWWDNGVKKVRDLSAFKKREYENNPLKCAGCQKILPYRQRKGKFCSHSCAAKCTNAARGIFKAPCFQCNRLTSRGKFCTNRCKNLWILHEWRNGRHDGSTPDETMYSY